VPGCNEFRRLLSPRRTGRLARSSLRDSSQNLRPYRHEWGSVACNSPGQIRVRLGVNSTRKNKWYLLFCFIVVGSLRTPVLSAQEQSSPPATESLAPAASNSPEHQAKVTIPAGTRLALVLQNSINTRGAKAGDSAYLQVAYPVALDNRVVIPAGTLARGEVVSVKRPGRIKGRAELQLQITSLVFSNGYVVSLAARPRSVDGVPADSVEDASATRSNPPPPRLRPRRTHGPNQWQPRQLVRHTSRSHAGRMWNSGVAECSMPTSTGR
jgi:hypothetical protein